MKPYLTIKELKGISREQLLGKYGAVIFAVLLFFIIRNTTVLITSIPLGNTLISAFLFHAISFVMDIFFGLFQFGLAKLYLNISSNRPFSGIDLFSGFKETPDRIIKVALPLAVISLVCFLPYDILNLCIQASLVPDMPYKFLTSIGIFALCNIIYYIILLNFMPVYYLLVDLPDISAKKAMRMSIWLMKGSRIRYFVLQFSFIPLQILGFLSCFVGYLWINPYMNTTYTHFYLDLSEKRDSH